MEPSTPKTFPNVIKKSDASHKYGVEQEEGWRTILFNCHCHTFDEVITQLMKCRLSRFQAEFTAFEIHTKGQGIVYEGSKSEATRIARLLASIGLRVQISKR